MADTIYYSSRLTNDPSIEAIWKDHRDEGADNSLPFWQDATRLKKFAARIQWPERQNKQTDPNRKAARLTVPETSRVLAAFSGKQIMQRVERQYTPQTQETARWAETWTKVDRAISRACDGEQVDSAAFRDGPGIQGISWVRWYVDEWSSDKPQLKYETVPIWQMMWPATRLINLQDRAWHRWGSWWPQSTVRARWRKQFDEIGSMMGSRSWTTAQQSTRQHSRIPWTGGPGNKPLSSVADYYGPKTRSLWIEYEEYRELEIQFLVARPIDPKMSYSDAMELTRQRILALSDRSVSESGEVDESNAPPDPCETKLMSPDELADFRGQMRATHGEDIPSELISRKQQMTYRYIYGCGDKILEIGDLPTKCFTFQAMAAEVVELEDETKYISLLSDLVDAQRMVNVMMSALVRDIQINPKGVLFVEQGLFRDRNEAQAAWTSAGGVVEIPRGRMYGSSGNKPWSFEAGGTSNYSSKLESMLAFYREAVPRLAGFNPAALGQLGTDIRRVSGEVVRQLADATMTSNAERVDALRLYRREGARIFMAHARILWEPEDLVRFIGESEAYDDVLDPTTGEPTGEKELTIPPKSAWVEDFWKDIAIEEVQPSNSAMEAFWDKIQTQVALLQSPMPDTGQPLFTAEDWVHLLTSMMPASMAHRMLARIKMQQKRKAMMDRMAQQQQLQQPQQPQQQPDQQQQQPAAA